MTLGDRPFFDLSAALMFSPPVLGVALRRVSSLWPRNSLALATSAVFPRPPAELLGGVNKLFNTFANFSPVRRAFTLLTNRALVVLGFFFYVFFHRFARLRPGGRAELFFLPSVRLQER